MDEIGPKTATALRLLGMNSGPAQSNPLSQFGSQPELRSYEEPWYRRLPNALTDLVYGDNANAQQAEWMRTLFGPANPINIPGQVAEGVDTARTGYQIGSPALMGAGAFAAAAPFLPGPGLGAKAAMKVSSPGKIILNGSLNDLVAASGKRLGELFAWRDGQPIIPYTTQDELFRNSIVDTQGRVPSGWHLVDGRLVYKPSDWYGGPNSSLAPDVKRIPIRDIDRLLTPKYDHFFRATNRIDEPALAAAGQLRRSYNHADNFPEAGLSVAEGPEYVATAGYPYGYRLRGERIGTGSDGEPLLDVRSLAPLTKSVQRPEVLIRSDKELRRMLAKEHGFENLSRLSVDELWTPFEWFKP